jgi:hypothetical protein
MRQAVSSNVVPAPSFDSLPFKAEQTSSRTAAVLMLLLLVPVLCLVIVPVGLVLVFATGEVRDAIAQHPLAAAIMGAGLAIWVALFLVPAKRIIQRFGNRRRVTIARERVTVADESLFGSRLWSVPLADFRGVAHHVRATLSGVRHELILVHPMRERSVLLHSADAIAQSTIDRAAALLRLQQVPAHELYRLTQRGAGSPAIEVLPEAQAA